METKNLSQAQLEARRANARKSTGPRTRRGKRHSRRNSRKHGLYSDVRYFYWDAAMELGEDPREFQRLHAGLLEDRKPQGTLEAVLVEDIAVLIWKKARLERAESAVQVCNVRRHDLERRKQYIQVGRDVTTVSQSEVLETGLRVFLDAPGTFEKVLAMLGVLEEMTERNEFTVEMRRLLDALYGKQPTLRGAGLINDFRQFEKLKPEDPEDPEFQDAKKMFKLRLGEETSDVLGEYEIFLYEHVENSRAARIAATAPSHAQWAETIRQQNALHRQLERKIRLLDEMQERRKKSRASEVLAKLGEIGIDSGEPQGGGQETPGGADEMAPPPHPAKAADLAEQVCASRPPEAPVGAALVAAQGQPQGLPLQCETQNRGNEAKKSLKTNEVTETIGAKRTHSCARKRGKRSPKSGISMQNRQSPIDDQQSSIKSPLSAATAGESAFVGHPLPNGESCLSPAPITAPPPQGQNRFARRRFWRARICTARVGRAAYPASNGWRSVDRWQSTPSGRVACRNETPGCCPLRGSHWPSRRSPLRVESLPSPRPRRDNGLRRLPWNHFPPPRGRASLEAHPP